MTTNDLIHQLVTRLGQLDPLDYDWSQSARSEAWWCQMCGGMVRDEGSVTDDPLPRPDPFPHADDCPYRLAELLAERLGLVVSS